MKTANWVHFACHGVQNVAASTESALLLAGTSRLTLSKIMELNLFPKDLAFLYTCQTAKGDEKLSDEAVHLAGEMLAAGYRGVVTTMWSMSDRAAPQVADDFYSHLFKPSSHPDPAQAAYALHYAVESFVRRMKHCFSLGFRSFTWEFNDDRTVYRNSFDAPLLSSL